MLINPGPFTYKQVFRFMGEQIIAQEGTEGLKIMDSIPAKIVMLACGHEFTAICSYSAESPLEQKSRMDDLYESTLSGENEHMCAFILINNLWHDHFE